MERVCRAFNDSIRTSNFHHYQEPSRIFWKSACFTNTSIRVRLIVTISVAWAALDVHTATAWPDRAKVHKTLVPTPYFRRFATAILCGTNWTAVVSATNDFVDFTTKPRSNAGDRAASIHHSAGRAAKKLHYQAYVPKLELTINLRAPRHNLFDISRGNPCLDRYCCSIPTYRAICC